MGKAGAYSKLKVIKAHSKPDRLDGKKIFGSDKRSSLLYVNTRKNLITLTLEGCDDKLVKKLKINTILFLHETVGTSLSGRCLSPELT